MLTLYFQFLAYFLSYYLLFKTCLNFKVLEVLHLVIFTEVRFSVGYMLCVSFIQL